MKSLKTGLPVVLGIFLSHAAWAQTAGITGAARDTSGAVLPGVSVEAASPALIEKTRTAVTDGQGRYTFTELVPGTYSVTFTLSGFSTYKREGIELSAGFTATANADMKVGALAETVTVTGASPIVDTQNVRSQSVMKYETLEALPSGARDLTQFASLTLGATSSTAGRNDVGGVMAESNTSLAIHGGRGDDAKMNYDGMNTNGFWSGGGGQMRIWKFNTMGVQETVVETAGNSAESETGGANVNMVPRDGSNTFTVHSIFAFANTSMASGVLPDDLVKRSFGTTNSNSLKKVWDNGFGMGGPVLKDRLWFYSAIRWWGGRVFAANNYFNKSTVFYQYVADKSQPAYSDFWQHDVGGRFTAQATSKHKITSSLNWQRACGCWLALSLGAPNSPDGTTSFQYGLGIPGGGMWMSQSTWTYPATNKLLFTAGANFLIQTVDYQNGGTGSGCPCPVNVGITEQTTGYHWGSQATSVAGTSFLKPQGSNNFSQRVSVSYVTGSHAFKAGLQTQQGRFETYGFTLPDGYDETYRGGTPLLLTEWASPFDNVGLVRRQSLFAQDQWTLNKLTLNLGLRFDHYSIYAPGHTIAAGPFVPARTVPDAFDLPNYKDVTPRLGVAYDVFGNGKTAIKASWGRYLMGLGGGDGANFAPANSIVQSTNRLWADAAGQVNPATGVVGNGNFIPDCVLTNPGANGECGAIQNPAFGQPVSSTTWDPSARTGWNTREYSYQYSLSVQHELRPGFGVTIGYNRTDWRNQEALINQAQSPSDFTPYCIRAPTDTRLGSYSGQQVCGLFDQNLNANFGQVKNLRVMAKDVPGRNGLPKEIFNGIDFGFNTRFGKGGVFQGGLTLGRTFFDFCWMNNLPNVNQVAQGVLALGGTGSLPRSAGYCSVTTPLWDGVGSQVKLQAVYPLPLDFVVSGSYKNLPGLPVPAIFNATNAYVTGAGTGTLGRNLSACQGVVPCTATASIPLLPATSNIGDYSAAIFDTRLNEVDLRLTKIFKVGRGRFQAITELYNVFNDRIAQGTVGTFGPVWQFPYAFLGGRLFKIGAQVDF